MTISEVHSIFKERFNRLSSDFHQDLSPYQIDRLINDGVFRIMQLAARNETTTKLTNLFASITYPDVAVSVAAAGDTYTLALDELTYPFYEFKRITANTNCGKVNVQLETYGRISDLLNDAFAKPSKQWKRLLATVRQRNSSTDRELVIYSVAGFTVSSVDITYIRQPRDVFFGGYDSPQYLECIATAGDSCQLLDNSATTPRTIDIHANYHSMVIDFAVEEALRSLGLANEQSLRQAKAAEHLIN
jgi:hypothetical protein